MPAAPSLVVFLDAGCDEEDIQAVVQQLKHKYQDVDIVSAFHQNGCAEEKSGGPKQLPSLKRKRRADEEIPSCDACVHRQKRLCGKTSLSEPSTAKIGVDAWKTVKKKCKKKLNSRLTRILGSKYKKEKKEHLRTDKEHQTEKRTCDREIKDSAVSGACSSDISRLDIEQSTLVSVDGKIPEYTESQQRDGTHTQLWMDNSIYVALDCEFVGIGPTKRSALGRCSIVGYNGEILCDIYSKPDEVITDYRTPWSGLRKRDMIKAVPFESAQSHIKNIIKDKIVIGHALHNDFHVLGIHHERHMVRDTAKYKPLKQMAGHGNGAVSLRHLTKLLLGRCIQRGEHDSIEDAKAAMELFKLVQNQWEEVSSFNVHMVANDTDDDEDDDQGSSFFDDQFWPEDIDS